MKNMKRRNILLATVIFAVIIGMKMISVEASASQVSDNQQMEEVDLSDYILQEGGLLPSESDEEIFEENGLSGESFTVGSNSDAAATAIKKALNQMATSCDLTSYQLTTSEVSILYFDILNENPEYFYVYGGYRYSALPGNKVGNLYLSYKYDKASCEVKKKEYDQAVAVFKSGVNSSWSDLEKVIYINDYLTKNMEYDTTYSRSSAYDALVEGTAVCQGYSLAFKGLAKEIGLESCLVTSDSLNHAWNMVRVNGKYYLIDVTWDDPIPDSKGYSRHNYMLKSSAYFCSSEGKHAASDWEFSRDGWSGEAASDTQYDTYLWDEIVSPFGYYNGYWYNLNGSDGIYQYLCDGQNFVENKKIVSCNYTWKVFGGSGYWMGCFSGFASYDGKFYYNSPDKIFCYDLKSGENSAIYQLTSEEKNSGYIYSIFLDKSNNLYYSLATSPNENSVETKLLKQIAPPPTVPDPSGDGGGTDTNPSDNGGGEDKNPSDNESGTDTNPSDNGNGEDNKPSDNDDENSTKPSDNGGATLPTTGKFASFQGYLFYLGDDGNIRCYSSDGKPVINDFKCDGIYTYYFQANGTAMRDRLTYHPDGVHVIYFDSNGHEVFSNFANVKKTIAGDAVDDYCFFDVNGYLYVDVVTYDQTGTVLYYANPYGVLERGKWFQFSESVKCADGNPWPGAAGQFGYANADGTLRVNQYTYDWAGRYCYLQGNGAAKYDY